jgi:hypothetical protein
MVTATDSAPAEPRPTAPEARPEPTEPDEPAAGPGLRDPRRWPPALLAALPPIVLGLALYLLTLMPGLGLWDTAEFQAIGPVLGIAHPTGYPTYTLLAWLASVVLQPFGDPALRANLLSALLMAGGAGLLAATATLLTRRVLAGIAAGVALVVAEQPWRVALSADPHALHVFFVALLLFMLATWRLRLAADRGADGWLIAAAVVYGLALGNHALTVLLAPGIAIFAFASSPALLRRPQVVLACAGAALLTTVAVYAYLPIRAAMDPPLNYADPSTWEGFSYLVFGEQFRGSFLSMPPLDEALRAIISWNIDALGFVALAAPLGAILLAGRWPALLVMLVAWFGTTWWFSLGYVNAAIERYYLGPLVVVSLLGGVAVAGLIDLAMRLGRARPELSELRSPLVVMGAVGLVFIGGALLSVPDTLPRVDQSDNRDGRRWVDSVMPRLERDAVVVSWWSFSTPMWYAQFVEGQRPDVFVVDDRTMLDMELGRAEDVIDRYLGQRPVYLIRLEGDLPAFHERYRLEPVPGVLPMWSGVVYRVIEPRDGG